MSISVASLADTARSLTAELRSQADLIDASRRMPRSIVDTLRSAGFFRMHMPVDLGGLELPPAEVAEIIESLAYADGSVGWCAMIGSGTNALASRLPEAGAREVLESSDIITGGTFHPKGAAVVSSVGYVLGGRWPFGSGCQHCDWLCGGAMVQPTNRGEPEHRIFFFPANEAEILDTWHVVGLRGTGSHDYKVRELFVPARRTMTLADQAWTAGPAGRLPIFSYLLSAMAAVPLGLARAALDDLTALALEKTPARSARRLGDRDTTQVMVGRAEAAVQSARAFLMDAVGDLWDTVCRDETVTMRQRALVRLAAVNAFRACADAIDLCFEAAGGTSVYDGNILQRAFRDVHTAGQHIALAHTGYETVGRVLLGMDPDTPLL